MKTISTPLRRILEDVVDNSLTSLGEFDSFDANTYVLVDASANFPTTGGVGDIVFNPDDSRRWATIVSVDSTTQITLDGPIGAPSYTYYSVSPAATAFQVVTDSNSVAQKWISTYSVGDKVTCLGGQEITYFNLGVATILSIDYDATVGSETATLTLDLPMYTSDNVYGYVKGEIQTIPVNEVQLVNFILEEDSFYAEITFNGDSAAQLYTGIASGDEASYLEFEKNFMDAVQKVLRSPWPTANAMIKDSYGMYFEY